MILLKNPRERSRFLRYSIVGGIGALVDFSILNLLITVFGVSSVIASVFSFLAAVVSNFIWNRFWTYPDSRSKRVSRQIMEFAAVSIIGLAIRTPVYAVLEQTFIRMLQAPTLQLPLSHEVLGRNIALASVIGIVMLWNFIVNRFWTFSDVD
jgi:putative flippase GtrA